MQKDKNKFEYLCDKEVTISQSEVLKKFVEKADVVIWDGMFTKKEIHSKTGWGHSSIEQGIDFLSTVNCGKIIISHHAPYRTDAELDKINQSLPHGFHLAKDGHVLEL